VAAFVAQRIDMGETEWHVSPGTAKAALAPRKHPEPTSASAAGSGMPKQRMCPTDDISGAGPAPGDVKEPCAREDVSDSVVSGQQTLSELESAVCGCLRCPLGSTRKSFVFGEGNPAADIMFVGEAPGAEEDAQGKPFIGRAGKVLTDMIIAMKLRREDVFIGNILKCRPPNNRDPKPEEIEKCEPILIRQIEIINPRIICALGRIAGQTLLRTKASLGSLREKFHDYHGVKLIVTYHPAALLRNPHWKHPTWEDLKMLRREYDGLEL